MSNPLFVFFTPCLLYIYHRFQSRNDPLLFSSLFNDTRQLSLSIARLHQFHFLQWDFFKSVYEVFATVCFATVLSFSTKALWSPQKASDRAGLLWKNWALFIHSGLFMKNYLLRKAFLYKLTQTFLLSVAVKIVY